MLPTVYRHASREYQGSHLKDCLLTPSITVFSMIISTLQRQLEWLRENKQWLLCEGQNISELTAS